MSTAFSTLYAYAQRRFHHKADANAVVVCKEATNRAMRRIAERDHPYFRTQGYINLVAPYSSGTVAVPAGGAIVSGTSATWTSAMTGRYIKIDDEAVHFQLTGWASGPSFSFDGGAEWPNAAVTAGTYVIYKDTYDLPSDYRTSGKIMEKRMLRQVEWLNDEAEWFETKLRNYALTGRPRWACMANGKLMFWPYETDISVLPFLYYRWPTEMSADADLMDFPDNLIDLVRRAIDWEIAIERGKESLISAAEARFLKKERELAGAASHPHDIVEIGGSSVEVKEVHYTIGADQA